MSDDNLMGFCIGWCAAGMLAGALFADGWLLVAMAIGLGVSIYVALQLRRQP